MLEESIELPYEISKKGIPFIHNRSLDRHNRLPDYLPFSINVSAEGLLVQEYNLCVVNAIEKAYEMGNSFSDLLCRDNEFNKKYYEDFFLFIKKEYESFKHLRVLEIGCGNCCLLSLFKDAGADVIGYEPRPEGLIGAEKYKMDVRNEYFKIGCIKEKVDLILLNSVLEHLIDYTEILTDVRSMLSENGRIAISVPDCTEYINAGDMSMFVHEHWNYFSEKSLRNICKEYLHRNVIVEKASYGGSIYAITEDSVHGFESSFFDNDDIKLFLGKANLFIHKIKNILQNTDKSETVGIYVPMRILTVLSMIASEIDLTKIRFFDDMLELQEQKIEGITIKIEKFEDLVYRCPGKLLIMSKTFGGMIKSRVEKEMKGNCNIVMWEDLICMDN